MGKPSEAADGLWLLTLAPAIWAAHFLLSYLTAALWCARFAGPDGSLGVVRVAIAGYTVAALIGIGATAWIAHRRRSFGGAPQPPGSAAARRRSLGQASYLLCGLAAVATLYVALAALFLRDCR